MTYVVLLLLCCCCCCRRVVNVVIINSQALTKVLCLLLPCAVISEMDFVASDKYIYSGNSVYLTCVVHMTHPNFTTITPKGSTEISKHYKNTVDDHAARTVVVIDDQKRLKEEYKCVMESYDKEKLVERLEKTISIYSYSKLVCLN